MTPGMAGYLIACGIEAAALTLAVLVLIHITRR